LAYVNGGFLTVRKKRKDDSNGYIFYRCRLSCKKEKSKE